MSSELKALVERNELKLPSERVQSLMRTLQQRAVAQLSSEKEPGPFMLYCLGNDLNDIASKTGYPVEVITLTAIYYKWNQKIELFNKVKDKTPSDIQKDLVNSLLVATYVGISRELGEVIAGKRSAADCKLIPKEIKDLEKLVALVNTANGIVPNPAEPGKTVVNAQNVQINQQTIPEAKKEVKEIPDLSEKSKALKDF